MFARVQVNATNFFFVYPGAPGASVFAARTRFTLQTAPRAATNPASSSWTTLLTTNASGTNVTFSDGAVGVNKERYFRVVSP